MKCFLNWNDASLLFLQPVASLSVQNVIIPEKGICEKIVTMSDAQIIFFLPHFNCFALKSRRMFVPNRRRFPPGVPELSRSFKWAWKGIISQTYKEHGYRLNTDYICIHSRFCWSSVNRMLVFLQMQPSVLWCGRSSVLPIEERPVNSSLFCSGVPAWTQHADTHTHK